MPIELPSVYGREYERRLRQEDGSPIDDPDTLAEIIAMPVVGLCPDGRNTRGGFSWHNGGRLYVDSMVPDPTNPPNPKGCNVAIETASPETTHLRDLLLYSHSQDKTVIEAIQQYLSQSGRTSISYQHRSSLGPGAVYGSHLNYGISHEAHMQLAGILTGHYDDGGQEYFSRFIANAIHVTGAGAIRPDGMRFSQKADGVVAIQGRKGNQGTLYHFPFKRQETSILQRVEVRMADTHPDDQAFCVQAGIGGIALGVAQLPVKALQSHFGPLPDRAAILQSLRQQNVFNLYHDGGILTNPDSLMALRETGQLLEAYLRFQRSTPGTRDLTHTAEEVLGRTGIVRAVLRGTEDVRRAADTGITWARRAVHILDHIDNTAIRQDGTVDCTHPSAREADQSFDAVSITPDSVDYGPGFAGATSTRWQFSDEALAQAMREPPADTVAAYRTAVLRKYHPSIRSVNWSHVTIDTGGSVDTIDMHDPLQTQA